MEEFGEYVNFFDNAENYLKALPILDKLRKFIVPYDNGEDFSEFGF